jgi:peptidoglycan/LPS O-acetylase OafA/YrhL
LAENTAVLPGVHIDGRAAVARQVEKVRYRRDIDGLRALAVLPVLMYHFGADWFPGGFTGVDIFFVISGFVIAGSIQGDILDGTFSVAQFYFKRIKRILPALTVTLLLTSIAAIVFLLPKDLANYGGSLAATSSFLSNIFFWKDSGYFTSEAQTKPLLHTWSLAVEEQYYLFAPMAFAAVSRWGQKKWLVYLGPVALLSLACSVVAVFSGPTAGFFLLPSRLWELLLGALLALSGRPLPDARWLREAVATLGLVLVLFGILELHEGDAFPGWNACYPCIGAALLIHAGTGLAAPADLPLVSRLLASGPFVWIGRISYSLYLVHWPIAAFYKYEALRNPSAVAVVCMLAATVVLAWISWRFVEQPFRRIGAHRMRLVLLGQVAATCLGIGLGVALIATHGLPGRFPDFAERDIPGVNDWGGSQCFNQNPARAPIWSAQACTRIRGANGRILLWGDSFAAEYIPGILRDRSRINADVLQYTFAGCPPVLAYFSYARVACSTFNRHALSIIRENHVDTVVLAAKWVDTPKHTIEQLGKTISTLRLMGVRVFVVGQSPLFIMNVQDIDYISGSSRRSGIADWTIAFDPKLNALLAEHSRGATFIDPLAYLCHGSYCTYRDGDEFYYSDYGHFSTAGSLRATRAYFPSGVRPGTAAEVGPASTAPTVPVR